MKRLVFLVALAAASLAGVAAWAAAPVGRYTIGDETVTDNVTGLVWQRAVNSSAYTWFDADIYCQGLTLAGMSDWRLPTITELVSLVDRRRENPSIDTAAFPNAPANSFWSSSLQAGSTDAAWSVDFFHGSTGNYGMASGYRARCVR